MSIFWFQRLDDASILVLMLMLLRSAFSMVFDHIVPGVDMTLKRRKLNRLLDTHVARTAAEPVRAQFCRLIFFCRSFVLGVHPRACQRACVRGCLLACLPACVIAIPGCPLAASRHSCSPGRVSAHTAAGTIQSMTPSSASVRELRTPPFSP
jgi:hypothetical protein